MKEESRNFYSVWGTILGIYLVEFSFVFIDSLMIAPFGVQYIAGVGIAGVCYSVILSFSNGFISIFSNIYARETANSKTNYRETFYFINILFLIVFSQSVLAWVLLYNTDYIMVIFHQPQEVIAVSKSTLQVLSYSYPISLSLGALNMLLRVHNNASVVFKVFIIGSIVNISSNALLLYNSLFSFISPEKSVAVATLFSNVIMLLFNLTNFKNILGINIFALKYLDTSFKYIFQKFIFISKKALPVGLRNMSDWLSSLLLIFFINSYGSDIGAANQISDVISSLMYRAPQAACVAIGIIFSKWLGTREKIVLTSTELFEQVKKLTLLSVIPSFTIVTIFFVIKKYIPVIFGFYEYHIVYTITLSILMIHFSFFISYFLQHILNAFLDALLDTKIPSIITFIVYFLYVVPVAFYLVYYTQIEPHIVWVVQGIGLTVIGIFNIIRLRKVVNSTILTLEFSMGK